MFVDPVLLKVNSDLGEEYLAGMRIPAGAYAYAGRDWVCQKVARILGANIKKRSTIITVSPGRKNISARITGWSAKAPRPRFPTSLDSSAEAWGMIR